MVLETEGSKGNDVFVLLHGEIGLYRRPENLYAKNGRLIRTNALVNMVNPFYGGNDKIGVRVGTMQGFSILGEDSLLFDQPMVYSLKTKEKSVVWRIPGAQFLTFLPQASIEVLSITCLEKYSWFFSRTNNLNTQLKESEPVLKIENRLQSKQNDLFPVAIPRLKKYAYNLIKNKLGYNEERYLCMHKLSAPSQYDGALQAKDYERLNSLARLIIPLKLNSNRNRSPPKPKNEEQKPLMSFKTAPPTNIEYSDFLQ